jgi:phosphoserine phosphatase
VRREHLAEVGRRIRLKRNIELLAEFFRQGVDGYRFSFYVVSAAPKEVIRSALDGVVPADHINGTDLEYDPSSGEIRAIVNVPAGYGKVAVLEELEAKLQISPDHTIYIGDGGSDIHVMGRWLRSRFADRR